MYNAASSWKGDWDILGISEETEKTAEDLRMKFLLTVTLSKILSRPKVLYIFT